MAERIHKARRHREEDLDEIPTDETAAAEESETKADTEKLLDEIDALLEDQEAIERREYAAMLKGWAARQHRLDRPLEQWPCCDECAEFEEALRRGEIIWAPPGYQGPTVRIPEQCLDRLM